MKFMWLNFHDDDDSNKQTNKIDKGTIAYRRTTSRKEKDMGDLFYDALIK